MNPAAPFFIDTHCHLDAAEFDADRDAEYARAVASGVTTLVIPAVSRDNFAAVAATCERYPGSLPAWGLHPMFIDIHRPEHLADLRAQVETQRPVAIGEIGLDLFVSKLDYATQEFFYVEQLKIAQEYDLPVLLHCRRANDEILKHLRRIKVRGGIAHAFNGSPQQANEFIKLGFKLGFGGAFTWPRANKLRRLAVDLPLDAIVLETDSPDMPPVWIGHGRNAPGELPRIAQTLAELRGLDIGSVAQVTTRNARELFRLGSSRGAL
ncbi:TatD family hydrolase [Thiobacillus denitrificans]|uniref:DNAase n=1 Tax=Thiobacillus denitrificans TaxID=36861 RepID=A0A106BVX2_THIDE|nr:TatD family hydrolase [Thiobacillus denitrificans]KVW99627.1 DNAase [Thiobacillus denitrificans]